ncbi:hypothetical protein AKO1_013555 [Acrasis kona]|uniref:Uncharacterized protein n=1 Tax=Acrasis kona TaxID=1008807 RepID=A0AAW2ZJN3_9EUKA
MEIKRLTSLHQESQNKIAPVPPPRRPILRSISAQESSSTPTSINNQEEPSSPRISQPHPPPRTLRSQTVMTRSPQPQPFTQDFALKPSQVKKTGTFFHAKVDSNDNSTRPLPEVPQSRPILNSPFLTKSPSMPSPSNHHHNRPDLPRKPNINERSLALNKAITSSENVNNTPPVPVSPRSLPSIPQRSNRSATLFAPTK